ncbi:hypothetical protein IC582_025810 [Cucumis melo]
MGSCVISFLKKPSLTKQTLASQVRRHRHRLHLRCQPSRSSSPLLLLIATRRPPNRSTIPEPSSCRFGSSVTAVCKPFSSDLLRHRRLHFVSRCC